MDAIHGTGDGGWREENLRFRNSDHGETEEIDMKRILPPIMWIFLFFLLATATYAATFFLTSSGEKTASAAVTTQKSILGGVLIITDGTNDATIIIYDNASAASGTKVWEAVVTGSDNYGGGIFPHPIRCSKGIYISIAGTGASAIVYYDLR